MSVREITDENLKLLNLSFGTILIILSVFTFFSFMIDNITQIIIISIALLTSGMTFFATGIPDNVQESKVRKIEAVVGSLISILGLTIFFIALLVVELAQLVINILLIVFQIILVILGVAILYFNNIERDETKKSTRTVMFIFGLLIIGFSIVNFMGIIFSLWPNEFIIILISITLLFHGISKTLLYITGVYEKR